MKIDNDLEQELTDIYIPLAATLKEKAERHNGPLLVGVNGAQGAGKSTLCRLLQIVLEQGFGQRVTSLSIDDIYLTHAERKKLAQQVHPLLATRGVPGTHDAVFGLQLLSDLRQLKAGQSRDIPLFDKAIDDRLPREEWRQVTGPFDLIFFEGWCVGAMPQPEETLTVPINSLERKEDPDLTWRRYVNQQLQEGYRKLFAELDLLIMLKVPGMESVMNWRGIQEQKLASATEQRDHKIMSTAELQRFIMHYERLTRAMLDEMQDRADLVFVLNEKHQIDRVQINSHI
jgi:D-glycerate 3-kinase